MKQNIRYVGFRSAPDGGRRFEFSVSASGQETLVSVEIAASHFAGAERVLIQEYSSMCYSKVKRLFEDGLIDPAGIDLVLTDSDVTQYRALQPEPEPRQVRADRVPY